MDNISYSSPESTSGKTPKEIFQKLREEFGEELILSYVDPKAEEKKPPETSPPGEEKAPEKKSEKKIERVGDPFIIVSSEGIARVCSYLRENSEFFFDSLMCLGGIDEGGDDPAICVIYCLHSFKHRHRVVLKIRLPRENPKTKSVQAIWSAANWHERETYDLFGVEFENHPDLRRLLLPPDWVGWPLRKDYEYPKEYNGISCDRAKLK